MGTEFGGATVQTDYRPTLKDWSRVLQLIDTKYYQEAVAHILRQEIPDPLQGGKWITPTGAKPLMNEEGITKILGVMNTMIDKTMSQGNFDAQYRLYNKFMLNIMRTINDDLFLQDTKYKIDDENKRYLFGVLHEVIGIYLTRLLQDKERKYIHGEDRSQRYEQYFKPGINQGKEKGSILD